MTTAQQLTSLLDHLYSAHAAAGDLMKTRDTTDPEWHVFYGAMESISAALSAVRAEQIRAEQADSPIPFALAPVPGE